MRGLLSLAFLCLISCRSYYKIAIPVPLSSRITGKDFYKLLQLSIGDNVIHLR
jgi:hypothetical protein